MNIYSNDEGYEKKRMTQNSKLYLHDLREPFTQSQIATFYFIHLPFQRIWCCFHFFIFIFVKKGQPMANFPFCSFLLRFIIKIKLDLLI